MEKTRAEGAGTLSGGLLLDKPSGITSAQAVARVKRLLPRKTKVGHTGTLDPLASGLLVILLGRATRLSRYVTALDKSYTATAALGAHSDTLDAEGDISPHGGTIPTAADIRAALPDFTGTLQQIPPMASAVKREGRRLYDLHRRGITVEREPREVEISDFTLVDFDAANEQATFSVRCSSGTYVRTLVSDLATAVGSAAYLTALRRTSVGHLSVEHAPTLDDLTGEVLHQHIIPTTQVVRHLPVLEASEDEARAVRHGVAIRGRGFGGSFGVVYGGELLGVYREDGGGGAVARPEVVLWG